MLPSPAPAPLPDRISLVTILVIMKVTSIARNIHIMGRSERSPRSTGILSRGETLTPDGIFTKGAICTREASHGPVRAAPTSTTLILAAAARRRAGRSGKAADLRRNGGPACHLGGRDVRMRRENDLAGAASAGPPIAP